MRRALHLLAVIAIAAINIPLFAASVGSVAEAQAESPPSNTGSLKGTITDSQRRPIAGAKLDLSGPSRQTVAADAAGTFSFPALKPGIYQLTVSKAGFTSQVQTDIAVVAGQSVDASVELRPTSFSSLQEIGRVSTAAGGANRMNTTTAAVTNISPQVFVSQGTSQVVHILDEVPGVSSQYNGTGTSFGLLVNNGTQAGIPAPPSIRGSLIYESESLIDGHPINVGLTGGFSPNIISPYLLQDVELIKGPGAQPASINYAIGGTVNYRLLEPTPTFKSSFDTGADVYGGTLLALRGTGTSGRLGYAVGYSIDGTPGALHNFPSRENSIVFNGAGLINGQFICGPFGTNVPNCPGGFVPNTAPKYFNSGFVFGTATACCFPINSNYYNRNELLKFRYSPSSTTSITTAYLGAQSNWSLAGGYSSNYNNDFFQPPAGYTGVLNPPGQPPVTEDWFPETDHTQLNLLETEIRSALGSRTTVLGRYYSAAYNDLQETPVQPLNYQVQLWGGLPINGGPIQYFNGQTVTLSYPAWNAYNYAVTQDHVRGFTTELDQQIGESLLTLSYDRSTSTTSAAFLSCGPVANSAADPLTANCSSPNAFGPGGMVPIVPVGSSQTFQTILAKGIFQLGPRVTATLGNYFVSYTNHNSVDSGNTFLSSTFSVYAPRLSVAWRPTSSLAIRLAAGDSIAPPFVNLLTTTSAPPTPNNSGIPTYYTQVKNSGSLAPEQAVGFNLGFDKALPSGIVVSADAYRTMLRNQFLNSTTLQGTVIVPQFSPNALPLYVTTEANLGHSEYEGVEVTVKKAPRVGFGFVAQGSLLRAFPYNLPANFYSTAAGPFTANLAVIPNINFQTSWNGTNAIGFSRVPYSNGYGELNYQTASGARLSFGATYYGNNNSYNVPAFLIWNGGVKYPLGKSGASVQLSAYNVFGAYASLFDKPFQGIPTPLANGQLNYTVQQNVGPPSAKLTFHFPL